MDYPSIEISSYSFSGKQISGTSTTWSLTSASSVFMYEIWWHDVSTPDMNVYITSCTGCNVCMKSLNTCLATVIKPYSNSANDACSSSCSSIEKSCSLTVTNCLNPCNLNCYTGCYDFASPKCISTCRDYCVCDTGSDLCKSCVGNLKIINNACGCETMYELVLTPSVGCVLKDPNCATYDTSACLTCKLGFYLSCPSPCTTSVKLCMPCPSYCSACNLDSSGNIICTQCASSYIIFPGVPSNSCVLNCPDQYYQDTTAPASCKLCMSGCLICTSSTICIKCIQWSFMDTTCKLTCKVGTYLNIMTASCENCPTDCSACREISTGIECTACITGYYVNNKACVICGTGTYYSSSTMMCENCSRDCDVCEVQSGVLVCITCKSTKYKKGNSCVKSCGQGYYSNTVAKTCTTCLGSYCLSCGSNLVCTKCKKTYYFQTENGVTSCVSICMTGKFKSGAWCYDCSELCTTCTSLTKCTACVANATLASGICACNTGYTKDSGKCIAISTLSYTALIDASGLITLTFSMQLNAELTTSDFLIQVDGIQILTSDFTFATVSTSIVYSITFKSLGISTYPYIVTLIIPNVSQILTSTTSQTMSSTPTILQIVSSLNLISCGSISNCSVCRNVNSVLECIECNNSECLHYNSVTVCLACCANGYYQISGLVRVCTSCPSGSSTCDSMGCLSCSNSYFLLDYNCIEDCGVGKYGSTLDKACQDCITNCDICDNSSTCIQCAENTVLSSDSKQCASCLSNQFFEGEECINCPTECAQCTSSTVCTQCITYANKVSSTACSCDNRYVLQSGICMLPTFKVSATTDSSRVVYLIFQFELINPLLATDISFQISTDTYTGSSLKLTEKISKQGYEVAISSPSYSGVSSIILKFNNFLYSAYNAQANKADITMNICPDYCKLCSGGCTLCDQGYFLKNSLCLVDCGVGYLKYDATRTCVQCSSYCEECYYVAGVLNCYKCATNYSLNNGISCAGCPNGTYFANGNCLKCPSLCTLCDSSIKCTKCVTNGSLNVNNLCECDFGFIESPGICAKSQELHVMGSVLSSVEILLTFNSALSTQLVVSMISISFEESTLPLDSYSISISVIPNSYTISLSSISLAEVSMLNINFQDPSSILSVDNYPLIEFNLNILIPIYLKCPLNCISCYSEDHANICEECKKEYYFITIESTVGCVASCPAEYYSASDSGTLECFRCSTNCESCNSLECLRCKEGNYMLDKKCVKSCELGYYSDETERICTPCNISNCDKCTKGIGFFKCTDCAVNYYLSNEWYFSIGSDTLQCILEIDNCIEYETTGEHRCIVCNTGYSLGVDNKCNECELDFIKVNVNPEGCAKEVKRCSEYKKTEYEWECKVCNVGYKLDLNMTCNECQDLYISTGQSPFECVLSTECPAAIEDCNDAFSHCVICSIPEDEESANEKETEIGISKLIEEKSTLIVQTVFLIASAVSIASLNFDGILCMIGTMQLLSYILLYNLSIPNKAKVVIEGMSIIKVVPNLFQYFIHPDNKLQDSRYERMQYNTENIFINSGENLSLLILSAIIYLVFKILARIAYKHQDDDFLKKISKKALDYLEWSYFISYFMNLALELMITACLNLLYLSSSETCSIIGFGFSLVILGLILIFPIKLFLFYLKNYSSINTNTLKSKYNILYSELKTKIIETLLLNILELIRKIAYGVSIVFLYSTPYIQVILNSCFSYTIFYFILIFKPYKTKRDNRMKLYLELNVFLILTLIGAFLKKDLSNELYNLCEWSLVVLLYMSILIPTVVNLISLVRDIIIYFKSCFIKKKAETIRVAQTIRTAQTIRSAQTIRTAQTIQTNL